MIWLTWRQFRAQAIVAAAALIAAAVTLAVTGPHLASLFNSNGLATCRAGCVADAAKFINEVKVKGSGTEQIFYGGIFLVYAVPALIGLFWGAPLISRELEAGTFRLAWNQSVPRARWIAVKLSLIGLAAMVTAGLLSLMCSWWASPLYQAAQKGGQNDLSINKLAGTLFGAGGIAPVGYAAFAFALGVTAGVLIRRTLPAMAVTLAIFVAIQIFWSGIVRPHLIPPVHATEPLAAMTSFSDIGETNNGQLFLVARGINGSGLLMSSQAVNAAGRAATHVPASCARANMPNPFIQCLASHGIRLAVTYQPASRYWAFQWLETGIFLILAGSLGALCYWRVRRLN
jgi:hypothetical protein